MRYSFVFVCQRGDLEIKALLLAASLRRFVRAAHEIVAAIPAAADADEQLSAATLAIFQAWGVRIAHLPERLSAARPFTNKIGCLRIPTTAEKRIFLDSDILCLHSFEDEPRFHIPFNAKPADRRTFTDEREPWRRAYAAAGVPLPAALVPSTVSKQLGPPYFNSGVVAVQASAELAGAWSDCVQRIAADGTIPNSEWWLDQVALAIAVQQLALPYDCLDERYNYPAHIRPLPADEPPYFCHYHTVETVEQEPRLRARPLAGCRVP